MRERSPKQPINLKVRFNSTETPLEIFWEQIYKRKGDRGNAGAGIVIIRVLREMNKWNRYNDSVYVSR